MESFIVVGGRKVVYQNGVGDDVCDVDGCGIGGVLVPVDLWERYTV